jgi:hypothetical protein
MPATKRRPHLPPFYLRYFSNAKEQVRVFRINDRQPPFTASVKKLGEDLGTYTLTLPDGADIDALEAELTRIESEAKKAIDGMLSGKFPPQGSERRHLSRFMSGHILASDWSGDPDRAVFEHLLRDCLAKIDRDDCERHLRELGLSSEGEPLDAYVREVEGADPARLLQSAGENDTVLRLHLADHAAAILMQRYWLLGGCAAGGVCAGDRPVVAHENRSTVHDPAEDHEHPEEREQIYFPIGHRHILAMSLAGTFQESEVQLSPDDVAFVNKLVAGGSRRYVFQHPEDRTARLPRKRPARA